jgi:hypothetical protein
MTDDIIDRQIAALQRWTDKINGPSPAEQRVTQLTEALHQIASASPCVTHPGTEHERACVFCRTLIDVARDALGRERWPAESVRPELTQAEKDQLELDCGAHRFSGR